MVLSHPLYWDDLIFQTVYEKWSLIFSSAIITWLSIFISLLAEIILNV